MFKKLRNCCVETSWWSKFWTLYWLDLMRGNTLEWWTSRPTRGPLKPPFWNKSPWIQEGNGGACLWAPTWPLRSLPRNRQPYCWWRTKCYDLFSQKLLIMLLNSRGIKLPVTNTWSHCFYFIHRISFPFISLYLKDWKLHGPLMGTVRAYDPKPPPAEKVDLNNFPLKLAELKVDNALKGLQKFRISLPNDVRSAHLSDPVHGGNWRDLVIDFDKKFFSVQTSRFDWILVISIPL